MENDTGIQTRAMTGAQRREDGAHRQTNDNTECVQAANSATPIGTGDPGTQDPTRDPTEDKTEDEIIEEFVRKDCSISLDWYIPNLNNTQVREIIKQ